MRMSGCPCLTRRRFRRDPTDALFADQSQSILDNLVALLGQSSPWNCSDPNAVIRNTSFGSLDDMLAGRDELVRLAGLARSDPLPWGSFAHIEPQHAVGMAKLPSLLRKKNRRGDRWFESFLLQRRVHCEPVRFDF